MSDVEKFARVVETNEVGKIVEITHEAGREEIMLDLDDEIVGFSRSEIEIDAFAIRQRVNVAKWDAVVEIVDVVHYGEQGRRSSSDDTIYIVRAFGSTHEMLDFELSAL